MTDTSAVFVHSGFRVSSTWFWTRLREIEGVRAYYECFHERLASVDRNSVAAFNTECWDSGHPRTAPYFAEFLPLISDEQEGIAEYDASMAFFHFLPDGGMGGTLPVDQRRYLQRLITSASDRAERPVLTFGRSLGRTGAIRRALGGAHILLLRDLAPQWSSYRRLGDKGVWYFLNATLQSIANGAAEDPFLASLKLRHTETIECRDGLNLLRFVSMQDYFEAMLALHLYLYRAALRQVDSVINVSAMARDENAANEAARRFFDATGLTVDFGDLSLNDTILAPDRVSPRRADEIMQAISNALGSDPGGEQFALDLLHPLIGSG